MVDFCSRFDLNKTARLSDKKTTRLIYKYTKIC